MTESRIEGLPVTLVTRDTREEKTDPVTEEVPLTVEVNGTEVATLLCSPRDLKSLAVGFLIASGMLADVAAIKKVVLDKRRWKASVQTEETLVAQELLNKRVYTSGCGKGIIYHNPLDLIQRTEISSNLRIEAVEIMGLMKRFLTSSQEYRRTRGVHSSALVINGELALFKEDIGRHNAIDKVIGDALGNGFDLAGSIVLTSGRLSSEIVSKILRCRVPVLVAAGAPTDQGVKIAIAANLTLVGRARAGRVIIYSGADRVV